MNVAEKLRALFTTYKGEFQNALLAAKADISDISMSVPSSSASNSYGWLSQLPSFRKFAGPRVVKSIQTNGYVIPNEHFELTIGINKNDVEDDNLGIYTPLVSNMAYEAARDDEVRVYTALLAGLTTGKGFDEVPYFSKVHPLDFDEDGKVKAGSATFSNMLWDDNAPADAPIWILADCSRPIKPVLKQDRKTAEFVARTSLTDENVFVTNEFQFGIDKRLGIGYTLPHLAVISNMPLNAVNYETARQMIMTMVGYDQHKPLGLKPTHLFAGTANDPAGRKLLNVAQINATDNIWYQSAKLVTTPYLDRA